MENREIKSPCCNGEMDCDGGGYDGEDIVPIRNFCKVCGQTVNYNGWEKNSELINPKTGKRIYGK